MNSNQNCSVYGCSNTYAKARKQGRILHLYRFPKQSWLKEQRKTWIRFAKRKTENGKPWVPSNSSLICSDHFIGGKKSNNPLNPSYNPSIYPDKNTHIDFVKKSERFKRKKLRKSIVLKAKSKLKRCGRRPKISIVAPSKILELEEDISFEDDGIISKINSLSLPPPAGTTTAQSIRDIFIINTWGMCLLCFRTCSFNPYHGPRQISKPFKMMMRFLNVNIWQLCSLPEKLTLPQRIDAEDLFVTMCTECESVAQQVQKLFPHFEKIKMQLDECCRLLQNSMETGRKTEERNYRTKIESLSPALVLQAKVAEKIRNETRSKCSKRLNILPQVRIKNGIPLPINTQLPPPINTQHPPPFNTSPVAVSPTVNPVTPVQPEKFESNRATCDSERITSVCEQSPDNDFGDHQNEDGPDNDLGDNDDDGIELLTVKKLSESAKPTSTCSEMPSSSSTETVPPLPLAQKPGPLSKKKLVVVNSLKPKSSVKILYSCYICKTKLPTKESIKTHFETYHSKNKPKPPTSAEDFPNSKTKSQSPTSTEDVPNSKTKSKPPTSAEDVPTAKVNSKVVSRVPQRPSKSSRNIDMNDNKCKICANNVPVDLLPHMVMTHGIKHFSKTITIITKWSDADVANIVNGFIDSCIIPSKTSSGCLNCTNCTGQFKLKFLFDKHIFRMHYSLLTKAVQMEAQKQIKEMNQAVLDHIKEVRLKEKQEQNESMKDRVKMLPVRPVLKNTIRRKDQNTCPVCAKDFPTVEELSKHRRLEHNFNTFSCDMCENEYGNQIALNFHRRTKHNINIETEKIVKKIEAKTKICHICSKVLLSKRTLDQHLLTHGEKEHCCDQCGYRATIYKSLQRHMLTHSGVKNFACTVCSKSFATSTILRLHIRTHTKEKPYQCDQCGIAFSQKSSLNVHVKNVHKAKAVS